MCPQTHSLIYYFRESINRLYASKWILFVFWQIIWTQQQQQQQIKPNRQTQCNPIIIFSILYIFIRAWVESKYQSDSPRTVLEKFRAMLKVLWYRIVNKISVFLPKVSSNLWSVYNVRFNEHCKTCSFYGSYEFLLCVDHWAVTQSVRPSDRQSGQTALNAIKII